MNTQSQQSLIKQQTSDLYDTLSQELSVRVTQIDVRDKVIKLNYKFFGYVASHTFINNSYISYEDKFQSAVMHFCECWWKWKWQGDESHRGYRSDLSFSVFFKPRIGEMIERELNEVKYSIRRTLCMKVGDQLGKHWAQVTYKDLSDPRISISPSEMTTLKATFGSLYNADLETHGMYISDNSAISSFVDEDNTKFETIEELLVKEMIESEQKLSESKLRYISEVYSIDINVLKSKLPAAESMLYAKLKTQIMLNETFNI